MLDALEFLLKIAMILTSIFMIGLVLIQRGKGGGLAGAFGASGGSSAFGTKAGDVFTRITITTGGVWILMAMLLVLVSNANRGIGGSAFGNAAAEAAKASATESRSKAVLPRSGEGTEAVNPEAGKSSATVPVTPPAAPAANSANTAPEAPVKAAEPKK